MRTGTLFLLPYFIFFLILSGTGFVLAEEGSAQPPVETAEEGWTVVYGSYAAISVQPGIDLKSAARKIDVDFARYDPLEKQIFLDKDVPEEKQLTNKIDILIRKTRKILDMYPGGFRVNIKIYNDQEALNNVYKDIFEEEANHKAFYVHKFHTIYISYNNLSESVLVHEIAHAVIDTYFTVLPPPKVRELLACYVDLHLKD